MICPDCNEVANFATYTIGVKRFEPTEAELLHLNGWKVCAHCGKEIFVQIHGYGSKWFLCPKPGKVVGYSKKMKPYRLLGGKLSTYAPFKGNDMSAQDLDALEDDLKNGHVPSLWGAHGDMNRRLTESSRFKQYNFQFTEDQELHHVFGLKRVNESVELDFENCLRREVWEEAHVELKDVQYLCSILQYDDEIKGFWYTAFFAAHSKDNIYSFTNAEDGKYALLEYDSKEWSTLTKQDIELLYYYLSFLQSRGINIW